uniref:Uncharacterized protein n=1 Tax=Ostreococcus mediterraneus TaxID=1486918 RepID=A0A7S0KC49_9CHLO
MLTTSRAPSIAARATTAARLSAPRRAAFAVARASNDKKKGFFEADLVNDLKSVDGGETLDGLASGNVEAVAGVVGLASTVVCGYSLYVLQNTGCGLPPGPFGLVGGLEGISYLVTGGLIVGSAGKKIVTGSGLPAGPGGVLGGAEGIAYLLALYGIFVFVSMGGDLPNAIPTEGGKCFSP